MSTNVQVYQTMKNEKKGKQINQSISNNKPLEQVSTLKYLWNVIDDKFKLSKHITYAAETNTKLVHSQYKSTKLTWGLNYKALQTIYKGEVLPSYTGVRLYGQKLCCLNATGQNILFYKI
jgi:hypothetical protein